MIRACRGVINHSGTTCPHIFWRWLFINASRRRRRGIKVQRPQGEGNVTITVGIIPSRSIVCTFIYLNWCTHRSLKGAVFRHPHWPLSDLPFFFLTAYLYDVLIIIDNSAVVTIVTFDLLNGHVWFRKMHSVRISGSIEIEEIYQSRLFCN